MQKEINSQFVSLFGFKGFKIRKRIKKDEYFVINTSIDSAFGCFKTVKECKDFAKAKNIKKVFCCKDCNEKDVKKRAGAHLLCSKCWILRFRKK
jgi:hypothetical protein